MGELEKLLEGLPVAHMPLSLLQVVFAISIYGFILPFGQSSAPVSLQDRIERLGGWDDWTLGCTLPKLSFRTGNSGWRI